MKIVVYTQLGCVHCKQHIAWLMRKEIPFEERNITYSKEFLSEFKKLKPVGAPCTVISGDDCVQKYFGHNPKTKNAILKRVEEKQLHFF